MKSSVEVRTTGPHKCLGISSMLSVSETSVNTSGHLYDGFSVVDQSESETSLRLVRLRLRPVSDWSTAQNPSLSRKLPEESDQFRFLHNVFLAHLKESVGLILKFR